MKKIHVLAAAAALAASAVSYAAVIIDGVTASVAQTFALGQASGPAVPAVVAPGAVYSNVTNFTGSGVRFGAPTGSTFTYAVADDLTTTLPEAGGTVTQLRFSIVNFNSSVTAITPSIRYYDDDGVDGGPGTLLGGFNFNAVNVNGGSVTTLGFTPSEAQQFDIPGGKVWALSYFSTASAALTANVGAGLFNPPDVGTSTIEEWDSDDAASALENFTSNNPSGFIYDGGYGTDGALPANFGYELVATAVPEPTALAPLAAGAALLFRRRRA